MTDERLDDGAEEDVSQRDDDFDFFDDAIELARDEGATVDPAPAVVNDAEDGRVVDAAVEDADKAELAESSLRWLPPPPLLAAADEANVGVLLPGGEPMSTHSSTAPSSSSSSSRSSPESASSPRTLRTTSAGAPQPAGPYGAVADPVGDEADTGEVVPRSAGRGGARAAGLT